MTPVRVALGEADSRTSNGIIDADGAHPREAERVSDTQDTQVVGGSGSMGSGGIAGARTIGESSGPEETSDAQGAASDTKPKQRRGKRSEEATRRKQQLRAERRQAASMTDQSTDP